MMMTLRTQMKLILWILVVAFLITIIFSWGMGGCKDKAQAGIIGEVTGKEIEFKDFNAVMQNQVNRAIQAEDGEPDQDALKKVRERAWDEYVEQLLKWREAQKLRLSVTDREVAHYVQFYPPPEIRQAEVFQRDGQFDLQAYQNYLRQPTAVNDLIKLEALFRNYLQDFKLLFHVTQAVDVTEIEIKDEFLLRNAKGKFEFIAVLFDDIEVDSSDINLEMMKRYYRLFGDRFKKYPQCRFAYVKFKLQTSGQDSADVRHEASIILEEIRNGADIAELAEEVSEDENTASQGGDLGWISRGEMPSGFDEAVFDAETGEVIGPIETRDGYHIIKVDDKRSGEEGEEVKARHILFKVKPSTDTREEVYTEAYNFSQEIIERGFSNVAREFDYKVDTTRYFSQAGYITGLGRMRMAAEFCFDSKVGTISQVYPVPDGSVVFEIVDIKEEGIKPFDEVTSSIRSTLKSIVRKNRAWDAAVDLHSRIETIDDMRSAAAEAGITVHVTEDSLNPNGSLPDGLSRDSDFLKEAFRYDEGEITDVIEGKKGYYIAYINQKTQINEEMYAAAHSAVYQGLVGKKQDAAVKNWVRELRIAADIQDYRYRFFRDF